MYLQDKRVCWVKSSQDCERRITANDLTPADDVRVLVTDFKGGGTKYEDRLEKEGQSDANESVKDNLDDLIKVVRSDSSNLKARFESTKAVGQVYQAGTIKSHERERVKEISVKTKKKVQTTIAETSKIGKITGDSNDKSSGSSESRPVQVKPSGVKRKMPLDYTEVPESSKPADSRNTKALVEEECEEEYREFGVNNFEKDSGDCQEEEEEYKECEAGGSVTVKVERSEECPLCHHSHLDSSSCPKLHCKSCGLSGHAIFNCPDNFSAPNSVESNFSGEFEAQASPKKEPGLSTPTSSGYWSDDAKEGPYFGKITWINEEKTVGFVEVVLDDGETKHVHVSGYDVKCGAETGDLVEFVLGVDTYHGRAAKRVKLVEKGLPVSEEEQIRGQIALKRSLEISAGRTADKKLRTEEVIDVRADINTMSDYSDIADHEDPLVKLEGSSEDTATEELYSHCICDRSLLVRCQLCPFYFLEAMTQHSLLEGESVTLLAKIQGNEGNFKKKLDFIRQIPYPFRYLSQAKFTFLKEIGRNSLVAKISTVFNQDFAFVTIQNNKSSQIFLREGDIVGICQSEVTTSSQVSDHFMFEPPSKQDQRMIPVLIKKSDFSCDDNNNLCGFARLGGEKMNYKNGLVRVTLRSDLQKKLKLIKSDVTVQISHNVWLELECAKGVFERANIGKDGYIGFAESIMDQRGVEEILSSVAQRNQTTEASSAVKLFNSEERVDEANAYDEMLSQIDRDMRSNEDRPGNSNIPSIDSLLNRTYKAIVGENVLVIPSKGEMEANLYLQDDDSSLDLKRLLKFQARVTSNEEFQYFNNCFEIEEQTLTIVNGICRASRSTKPCVKVKITNPRGEKSCLKKDSPLALVKVVLDPDKDKVSATTTSTTASVSLAPEPIIVDKPPPPVSSPDTFKPDKYFQKHQRKFSRKWDLLCAENAFQKSLNVEQKYPYFKFRPKVPFGLKDLPELNMRVGISQDSKPVKVLDKVNGVFTCTICDVVILDKYSLQDHWYSATHKTSMKMVQVIAGPQERLVMSRPVVQEMLDQFNVCPLLGLEFLIEIVKAPENSRYYCSLCSLDLHVTELILHLTSLNHNLAFIKKFFPVAWERFSVIPDFKTWHKIDFQCLDLIIEKINDVHGRKRPIIVEDSSKVEESLEKMSSISYSVRRTELENFFRSLKPAEKRQGAPSPAVPVRFEKKIESRAAVSSEKLEVGGNSSCAVTVKIVDASGKVQPGRFLRVFKNPVYKGSCQVKPGFSRVWTEGSNLLLKVIVTNKQSNSAVILEGDQLAVVTL